MPRKLYTIRNPRGIPGHVHVVTVGNTQYYEGDKIKRIELNDEKNDLEALVGLGIITIDDLDTADSEVIESSVVKGFTLDEVSAIKGKALNEREAFEQEQLDRLAAREQAEILRQEALEREAQEKSDGSQ